MEIRTNEIKTLVTFIKTYSPEQAALLLRTYGDVREERGIESGWDRCNIMHKRARALRLKRERAFVLEADNNFIEVHEFNKLLWPILDMLDAKGLDDEIAILEAKIGKVKMDRRLTFIND